MTIDPTDPWMAQACIARSYLTFDAVIPVANRLSRTTLVGRIILPEEAEASVPATCLVAIFDRLVGNLRSRYGLTAEFRICLLDESCHARNAVCLQEGGVYVVVLPYEMVNHLMFEAELVLACEPFVTAFGLSPTLIQVTLDNAHALEHRAGYPVIAHPPALLSSLPFCRLLADLMPAYIEANSGVHAGSRSARASDGGDILHAIALPYCDLVRTDAYFADLLTRAVPAQTGKVVRKLQDLPGRIDVLADRPARAV